MRTMIRALVSFCFRDGVVRLLKHMVALYSHRFNWVILLFDLGKNLFKE